MFCKKCGNELGKDALFCVKCGTKVNQETVVETVALYAEKEDNVSAGETSLKRGTILGGTYEVIEEIGSGGGGIVYRARHLRLQTDVVVKKIKDEVRGKVKSRQEADILKQLKHPYLPRVYDFIETEDGVYTVMDFIRGENLDEAVKKNGKYTQKQVRKWAEQLGEALDYLHGQNPPIVHSDIKPANIMLTKDGDVCLIDFNISLAMGSTMESAVGISAGFSPPEQYRDPAMYEWITHNYTIQKSLRMQSEKSKDDDPNESKTEVLQEGAEDDKTEILRGDLDDKTEILQDSSNSNITGTRTSQEKTPSTGAFRYVQFMGKGIDARSDIYSLGVTLYFLLTGTAPSMDFDERTPVARTGVPVSEGFSVILDKMMELAPADRYQNGGEFLKAIRNCHKFDHRYIVMHRKQTALQTMSLMLLGIGIVTVFGGLAKLRTEQNSAYYTFIQQAQDAMDQNEFEDAENILDGAKELSETRVEAYEKEVHLLYLKEDYAECIKIGEMYINTIPFHAENKEEKELLGNIYYIVGNAYFEQEDYTNAEKLFELALKYNAQNGLYYRDYAITLAKLGRIENAEEELEKGIAIGIGEDSVYMAQGEIAHVKRQYETAEEYLKQVIATTTDMQMKKRAILLCTAVYQSMGNEAVDEEIAFLEQYAPQFEGNGNLIMTEYLAEAYARKASTDEAQAQECYETALSLFGSIYEKGYVTYQLQENMAIFYENIQQFDKAEELLQEMTAKYPERYEVYKRLAYLEADREQTKPNADRNYRQMLAYYEQAKEKYSGKEQDTEMDMLEVMMQELRDGGWL